MPLDPDTLRLAEHMMAAAKTCAFGSMVAEVTVRFRVPLRDGKCTAAEITEVLPRVTIEQLRQPESVIT